MKMLKLAYVLNEHGSKGIKTIFVNPQHVVSIHPLSYKNGLLEEDLIHFPDGTVIDVYYNYKLIDGTMIKRVVRREEREMEDFDFIPHRTDGEQNSFPI